MVQDGLKIYCSGTHSKTMYFTVFYFECLLLFITFSTCFAFCTNNKVWRTCFVESGELVAGSDIRKEEFVAESLMECNFIANENKWSYLMCHKNKNCTISNQLFGPNFEPQGLTNPEKCFTALEKPRPELIKSNFFFERNMNWKEALIYCKQNKAIPFVPKTKAEYEFIKSLIGPAEDRNFWYPMVYHPDEDKVIYTDGTEMNDNPFNPPIEDYDPTNSEKSESKPCSVINFNKKFLWSLCFTVDMPTLLCRKLKV
ncbi:UNVERIFIED_CONTAM: hypothetical protein RMT77_007931 [Armadillidium vulgare]